MEQLNRVELRGTVGNVRVQKISGVNVANLTLATNLAYRGREGEAIIETTWHNVTAWECKEIQNLDQLEKGTRLCVIGRIRNQRFVGVDGVERTMTEVVANRLTFINGDEPWQYQM